MRLSILSSPSIRHLASARAWGECCPFTTRQHNGVNEVAAGGLLCRPQLTQETVWQSRSRVLPPLASPQRP